MIFTLLTLFAIETGYLQTMLYIVNINSIIYIIMNIVIDTFIGSTKPYGLTANCDAGIINLFTG